MDNLFTKEDIEINAVHKAGPTLTSYCFVQDRILYGFFYLTPLRSSYARKIMKTVRLIYRGL